MGYHDAFFVAFLILLIPLAIAFFINDKDAEETLQAAVDRRAAAQGEAAGSVIAPTRAGAAQQHAGK